MNKRIKKKVAKRQMIAAMREMCIRDSTFNFVVSILYTQLFNLLCDKADDEYGGRLPVHVRCLLDEFAVRS